MASFQLQSTVGRGTLKNKDNIITLENVIKQIELGSDVSLNYESSIPGHPKCSRYGVCLEVNGNLYDCFDDPDFVGQMLSATSELDWDRKNSLIIFKKVFGWLIVHPEHIFKILKWGMKKITQINKDLLLSKGRLNKISFFLHSFMSPCSLDKDRIGSCAFHTFTQKGPISMCMHNTKRDEYMLPSEL